MISLKEFRDIPRPPLSIEETLANCVTEHNITAQAVSNMTGLSRGYISHLTNGSRRIGKKSIPTVTGFLGRYEWFGTAPYYDVPLHSSGISTGEDADPFPHIPQALKDISRWLTWKSVKDLATGKIKKIPVNAAGHPISGKDPANWLSYEEATTRSKNIGFQFSERDNICGIDLDNCIDNIHTGEVEEWANDIVFSFGSYTETSPSGTGLHIICKADIDHTGINQNNLEMYSKDRFFTFTGDKYDGESIEDCTDQYKQLLSGHQKSEPIQELPPVDIDKSEWNQKDKDLCSKIAASKQGDRFEKLFTGNTSIHGGDDSAADMALCTILAFWTQKDSKQIDRIFRQSKLYRDKWDSMRGESTYGQITISKAIAIKQHFFCKFEILSVLLWPLLVALAGANIKAQPSVLRSLDISTCQRLT